LVTRILFGLVLGFVGVLYLILAFQAVRADVTQGDWVGYLGALLFLAAGVGATVAAINLMRAKRR
jgi:protein-S-isoprenylcysteine O-methyltransferase Ste14